MSSRRLADKVAFVSGGARGIGAAVARVFVSEGAHVVIGDVLEPEGRKLVKDLGPDAASFVPLDVRSSEEWDAAISATDQVFGPPTILANCAGQMIVAPFEDTTPDQFRAASEVNVIGTFLGIRAVIEPMKRSGGGSIIVFSSAAGMEGSPMMAAYAASKAANANLARTAAMELGKYGIRVNAIVPGGIDTPMSNMPEFDGLDKELWYSKLPIPRIGQPHDVATVTLMLASDDSAYVTGSIVFVDGGMLAGHSAL
jgi:3alpha(or 20beta)-hydroxysteroid dehydrogenase